MDRSKWEYKKLGDCFAYIKNGANIKQISGATGIPITRIETLSNDVFNRDRMGYANIDDVASYSSNILNDGDILMSHINSMKFLGRAVEYKKKDDEIIIHGMNLLRMIPTSNFLSSYAVYQFKTDHFRKQVKAISHQAVNQASFNVTNLKGLNLIVPPVADQQRIVAELDCLNEMIALKQEQLKEFDKLAQSIFYDMFGDPVTNEKGWDCSLFGECIKLRSGDGLSAKDIIPGEYPVYGGNGIVGYHKQFNLDEDAIIIGRVGALCGNVRNVKGRIFVTDNAFILSQLKSFENVFLKNLLEILDLRKFAREAMQPVISNKTLKDVSIILPPLALQQQFAEKIQAIEAQKELVKKSIAETQQLLDSRMDYYFD